MWSLCWWARQRHEARIGNNTLHLHDKDEKGEIGCRSKEHIKEAQICQNKLRDAAMEIREKCLPCAESPLVAVNLDRTGLPCFLLLLGGLRSGCCCSCCCSPTLLCCLPPKLSPSNVQKQMGGSCKLVFLLLHVPARGTLHL